MIIAISGSSCSGKSTAANKIGKVLKDSVVVHGDDFLMQSMVEHKRDVCNIIGDRVNMDMDSVTISNILEKFGFILPIAEQKMVEAVKQMNVKQNIVVEYLFLEETPIWDIAQYKITIRADQGVREQRIDTRFKVEDYRYGGDQSRIKSYIKLRDAMAINRLGIKPHDLMVINNGTSMEEYLDIIEKIAMQIAMGEVLTLN